MSVEYLKWNITKESGRPVILDEDEPDKDTRKLCLVKMTETEEDLKNLCHVTEFESVEHKLGSNIRILCYDAECEAWFDESDEKIGDFYSVYAWYPLSYITDYLDGKPEPMNCWEFGWYTAKRSIPALAKWIEKGVSYHPSMSPDAWRDILTKIKQGFEVSLSDLSGDLDDVIDLEERKRILEEHDAIRKEAFALMAEYYLDLWD